MASQRPLHQAACQCGGLRADATADPDFVIACSCDACQRRTGSAYGIGAYFPRASVTIGGARSDWRRNADSGRAVTNHFCPTCGTTVAWELEMRPDHVAIAAGCMSTGVPEPQRVVWSSRRAGWLSFPAHWPTLEQGSPTR